MSPESAQPATLGATAGKGGEQWTWMGKKTGQELVEVAVPRLRSQGRGGKGGIAELLAPGKGRWGQFFSLIWATGKWIFTGSEEPLNLGEEKFLFLFTGTRSLSGQMCVRGRWRQGKRSVFTAKCPGLGLREALARQPSHKLVVCPWPS